MRVTNKNPKATKPLNILMVTRTGVKPINAKKDTNILFAA